MAEKSQNSSKKTNAFNLFASVPRILKNQKPLNRFQRGASQQVKRKSSGGIKVFFAKTLIGGGAVFLTSWLGVWGDADESAQLFSKIKGTITRIENKYILSTDGKDELEHKLENTKILFTNQMQKISKNFMDGYERSEKYITDLFKGAK